MHTTKDQDGCFIFLAAYILTTLVRLHNHFIQISLRGEMKTLLYWGWSSLAGLILFSILAHGEMKTFNESNGTNANVLMVGLTLVQAAAAKGAGNNFLTIHFD